MKRANPFASSQGVNTITPEPDSRRELPESTKLSRLPSLPRRTLAVSTVSTAVVVCVNCQTELTEENQKVKSAEVCTKCVSMFAVVGSEFDRAADQKSREVWLARFGGKASD